MKRIGLFVLALLLVLPAGSILAQDASSFKEYRPKVRELKDSDVPNDPRMKSVGKNAGTEKRLPTVETGKRPAPPRSKKISPIALPPKTGEVDAEGDASIRATRAVQLPSTGMSADREFRDNLKKLEKRIETLKERVIETKARLLNYSQKVAKGYAAGTQVSLRVVNELGKDFIVEKVSFYLDGHQVYLREFDIEENVGKLSVYRGSVLPGRHRIDVEVIVRGDEGLFDFGYGARLRLESGEYFNANEGKILQVGLVLFDRGGMFKSVDTRPGVRFDIEERDVF